MLLLLLYLLHSRCHTCCYIWRDFAVSWTLVRLCKLCVMLRVSNLVSSCPFFPISTEAKMPRQAAAAFPKGVGTIRTKAVSTIFSPELPRGPPSPRNCVHYCPMMHCEIKRNNCSSYVLLIFSSNPRFPKPIVHAK